MEGLCELGQALRERRKDLRIPRTELARRVGVSTTYLWLVEEARPRPGGHASRPSRDLLERWMAALGMQPAEMEPLLQLAGYFQPAPVAEAPLYQVAPVSARFAAARPLSAAARLSPAAAVPVSPSTETSARLSPSDSTPYQPPETEALTQQLRDLLALAAARGRQDETARLLNSFLRWLTAEVESGGG